MNKDLKKFNFFKEIGFISSKNTRSELKKNEDRLDSSIEEAGALVSLADGHDGNTVVDELMSLIGPRFFAQIKAFPTINEAITHTYKDVNDSILKKKFKGGAVVVHAWINLEKNKITFFHLGDCQGLLIRSGKILFKTECHDSKKEIERNRYKLEYPDKLIFAPVAGVYRFGACILPSRFFGDLDVVKAIFLNTDRKHIDFITTPGIHTMDLCPGDVIILASDGISLSHFEKILLQKLQTNTGTLQEVVESLATLAREDGSYDDITLFIGKT